MLKMLHAEDPINEAVQRMMGAEASDSLRFSRWFAGDYLMGVITVALVYALGSAELKMPRALVPPITMLAGCSFSLYLVHYPLLHFFAALLPGLGWLTIALSFFCALAFGAVFEPRKDMLRRFLTMTLVRRAA